MDTNLENLQQELKTMRTLAISGLAASYQQHDINSAIGIIREYAYLIRLFLEKGKLDKAIGAANKLDSIMKELHLEATTPLPNLEKAPIIQIDDVLKDYLDEYTQRFSNVLFTYELSSTASVYVDPVWLIRCVKMIIENALNAMKHQTEKHIIIKTLLDKNTAQILISDTGEGILTDIQQRLLIEPIIHSEAQKGIGIGLILVKIIVETYNGEIKLIQSQPGNTIFSISFPISSQVRS